MTSQLIEKLIQRQINQWNRYEEILGQRSPDSPPPLPGPTVTISRQLGTGGHRLANALAERMDLQVHGHEIVDHIAHDAKLATRVIRELDERVRSQINLWVEGILNKRLFLRDEFHIALVRTVRALAIHGGVVILGRGGNLILAGRATLRVRLLAPMEDRIVRVIVAQDVDRDEAISRIETSDRERGEFVRDLFHADIDDPENYDMVLNRESMDDGALVNLVTGALQALEDRREKGAEVRPMATVGLD